MLQLKGLDPVRKLDIRALREMNVVDMFSARDVKAGTLGHMEQKPDHILASILLSLNQELVVLNDLDVLQNKIHTFRRPVLNYEFRWLCRRIRTASALVSLE